MDLNATTNRRFWVSCVEVVDNWDHIRCDDMLLDLYKRWMGRLIDTMRADRMCARSTLFFNSEGEVAFSGVIEAASGQDALQVARDAFTGAVEKVGGRLDLPKETEDAWRIHHLDRDEQLRDSPRLPELLESLRHTELLEKDIRVVALAA